MYGHLRYYIENTYTTSSKASTYFKTAVVQILKVGQLPETEEFLFAIQDQVITTRNCQKHILKDTNIIND